MHENGGQWWRKNDILLLCAAVTADNKTERDKWWRSGHLHKRNATGRSVDFNDDWADYFDAYARSYEKNAFAGPGLEAISKREVDAMVCGVGVSDVERVLEVGSGEGRLTRALLKAGYEVQATDGAVGMVNLLADRHPQTKPIHMLLDGERLPFENASFDAVAGLRVWKYVDKRNAVLCEMRRVIKEDGLLILEWTSSAGAARFGYRGSSVNLLSRADVESELRATGFDVVSHTTTTRIPQAVWKISSSARYVSLINAAENVLDSFLRRFSNGTMLSRSVVTVAKAA